VKLESFASGDSGSGPGGADTLLESLHAFKDKAVKSARRIVNTMFGREE
jgi:hypothetical protein